MKSIWYPSFDGKNLTDDFIFTDIIRDYEYINISDCTSVQDYVFERNRFLWRVQWDLKASWVKISHLADLDKNISIDELNERYAKTLGEFHDYLNEVNKGDAHLTEDWVLRCAIAVGVYTIEAEYRFEKESQEED